MESQTLDLEIEPMPHHVGSNASSELTKLPRVDIALMSWLTLLSQRDRGLSR